MGISSLAGKRRLQCRLGGAVLPRQRYVVVPQQAVIGQTLDRREVPMGDVLRSLETADVVRHRTQTQVDANPVPGGEISRRGVHQAPVEQDHRSSRTFGGHQTTTLNQLADGVMINSPQWVAG